MKQFLGLKSIYEGTENKFWVLRLFKTMIDPSNIEM